MNREATVQNFLRTPSARRDLIPIVVPLSADVPVGHPPRNRPSSDEARRIARAIRPRLNEYAAQYDAKKYWPDVYASILREFRGDVGPNAIRDALLWKWGHLGKTAIPAAHTALIRHIQNGWIEAVAALPHDTRGAFQVLDSRFGPNRFITIAFLLHLLRPRSVPIVDQHNFRAVNSFMSQMRPGWHSRAMPSRYRDLEIVALFMAAVLKAWRQAMPVSVPSDRKLDQFLMMYGKALKGRAASVGPGNDLRFARGRHRVGSQ